MKNLYFLVFLLFAASLGSAQNDTLLFEDFQIDPSAEMVTFPDPPLTDSVWVNWDEDGKATANAFPLNWFFDLDWSSPDTIAAADSNFVFLSRSWLADFDTIASNWLISPAIEIVDDKATLSWKSAPFQGPRYMDGYAVKILVGSQDPSGATSSTVFRAAEMTAILVADSSLNLADFEFSTGYIHAGSYTDTTYFDPADLSASEDYHLGILEPHSVSLAQFAGETIFVAFHHDSADDNMIMLDDILLLGTAPIGSAAGSLLKDFNLVAYPNPVEDFLQVTLETKAAADISLELVAQDGKRLASLPKERLAAGSFFRQMDMSGLPAGSYSLVLMVDNQRFVKNVVKR